ncbi:putative ATPase expression protein 1 [[Candida] jaroonii]|uniref:ATPase expression protein 1 n=1 Tax=[Candida] jaroonii TaxID=467808 RepID=A0ACA9Y8R3_9ASCO|nr:putative ATPase expression protein 1 [[Candida] jaroonii]
MLRSVRGTAWKRYFSSKPNGLFTPNEEIEATSIPSTLLKQLEKPRIEVEYEMLSPEHISDLILKPSVNDLFFISFAMGSPFLGKDYQVIPKDPKDKNSTVFLKFSDIANDYINVFNQQVKRLNELPSPPVIPLNQNVEYTIQEQISKYKEDVGELDLFEFSNITHLGNLLQLAESYRMNLENKKDSSLSNSSVTIDNFCIFLLSQLEAEVESFPPVISFIESNLGLFNNEGLTTIVQLLISRFQDINDAGAIEIFQNFITKIYNDHSYVASKLDSFSIDVLARKALQNGEYEKGSQILKVLVERNSLLPSNDTITRFFESLPKEFTTLTKEQFIRETSFMKPAIFQSSISEETAKVILRYGVENLTEMEHFMRLIPNNITKQLVSEIISKTVDISETSLTVTQMVVCLLKTGATLNEDITRQIQEFYKSKGQDSNKRYLN